MDNKFWYVSYVRKRLNEVRDIRGAALVNFHPLKAVNQWNRDDEFYSFVIISFQEISREEYDIATEDEDD